MTAKFYICFSSERERVRLELAFRSAEFIPRVPVVWETRGINSALRFQRAEPASRAQRELANGVNDE